MREKHAAFPVLIEHPFEPSSGNAESKSPPLEERVFVVRRANPVATCVDTDTARYFRLSRSGLAERLPRAKASRALRPVGLRAGTTGLLETSLHARVDGGADEADLGETVDVFALHGSTVVAVDDVAVFTIGAARWDAPGLDDVVAAADDALAAGPLDPGALSHEVTLRIPAELSHYCRPCGCVHVKQQLYWNMVAALPVVQSPDGRFDRADRVLGRPLPAVDRTAARHELVRRFLSGFAPVTAPAAAWWLLLNQREARAALAGLGDETATVDYGGQPAYVLAADIDNLAAERPRGTRLIPAYDSFLTTVDRASIAADPADQAVLWRAVGNSGAVVVDGDVVAAWRPRKTGPRLAVSIQPFSGWQARHRRAVATEAEGVAAARGCELASFTVD